MNRLEEMLLKWQDTSLSSDEKRELNALLCGPEARAQLVREFQFDTLAREVLREEQAAVAAITKAQEFESAGLREPLFERKLSWWESLSAFLRHPLPRLALSVLLIAFILWFTLRPAPNELTLSAGSRAVTVERGWRKLSEHAGSFALRAGDKITVAEGGTAVFGTRSLALSATLAGPAVMTLQSMEDGPQLRLRNGEFSITSHAVPGVRIEAGSTVAFMEHGALTLHAQSGSTRLEVESGNVRWLRLDDGRELTVSEGYFAMAGADVPFKAEPLIPPPWLAQDVGETPAPTFVRFDHDTVRVASGFRGKTAPSADWRRFGGGKGRREGKRQGHGKGFHFVYRALRGDGEIRARVVPESGAASIEAGLVVRRDLTDDAPMAFVGDAPATSDESATILRGFRGGRHRAISAVEDGERRGGPYWVRLVRQGDTVTAYRSKDGRQWAETGSETLQLAETAYVGLAAAPRGDAAGSSVAFENISVITAR
jgi:hypothetical protein